MNNYFFSSPLSCYLSFVYHIYLEQFLRIAALSEVNRNLVENQAKEKVKNL